MNNKENNANEFEINWSKVPVISEITCYIGKTDIIELSKTCKYFRLKLESQIFYQLNLINQDYCNYCKANRAKTSGRKFKMAICTRMIKDLASKTRLVQKVVINHRISSKFANLFFERFKYCKIIIIDCKCYFKLSAVYNILRNLLLLKVLFIEAVFESKPENSLSLPSFQFPKTIKSISVYPYILEKNFIPAINEINFKTHKNLVNWKITGRYNVERFFHQQHSIIHLYLREIPAIEPVQFQTILGNNPQLKTLVYELEAWSVEKLNSILTLPNLKKLQVINYCFDKFNLASLPLITNKTIKTIIIECSTPAIVIEALLTSLEALEDIIFISWNLDEQLNISWSSYKRKYKSIKFGFSFWNESDIEEQLDCLKPHTKIEFDFNLKKVINYNLSV